MKKTLLSKCVGIGVLFLFANINAQSTESLIKDYISKDVSFRNNSNVEFKILNEDNSSSLKSNVVNVQQYYENTPVYQSLAKAIIRDGKVVYFKSNFEKVSKNIPSDKLSKSEAFSAALISLKFDQKDYKLSEVSGNQINLPDEQVTSIRYYFQKGNGLIPAQLFFIKKSKENKFFATLVSLTTGEILESHNLIDECSFYHDHDEKYNPSEKEFSLNNTNKIKSSKNQNKAATDASYKVFPLPLEAPTFGSITTIQNPWDIEASPEGWHFDGKTNYNNTRGNNVFAYLDNEGTDDENGFSPNSTTNGSLTFDFPYLENNKTSAYYNKSSAITNLFYANNMMHDIMYKFGFTESGRNYQATNFGKGGGEGDAVKAEGFDGSGYNNANFYPGAEIQNADGSWIIDSPRMQMYLFNMGIDFQQRLFYNDPVLASRKPVNSAVGFYYSGGKYLMETPTTGDLAIPSIPNACSSLTENSLDGKIALVTTGGCNNDIKIRNAQSAGAKGVVLHNTSSNEVTEWEIFFGYGINIPMIMIPKDEGNFITEELNASKTVNVRLQDLALGYKNSSFDNGIIIHEYGHGVSNRLTGQGYGCLRNKEQMGEGWSDFFALMLTNKPSYTSETARGMGTYAMSTPINSVGIRKYKYATDMTINPQTYASTNKTGGSVHAIGAIWATMLWDLHWKMAEKYGYDSDLTANPNSGSAKTMQLVMDGLKLQPCHPDFVSGRDAILEADNLNGGADSCLIWSVFARRGLGVNASAGSSTSITDQVEDFTVPSACTLGTEDVFKNKSLGIYPNPAKGEFYIKTAPEVGTSTIKIEILDMNGKIVKSLERRKNSSDSISTKGLVKGIYLVVITENGKSNTEKLIIE